ncbi:MAG: S-layer homology domain-containing protein [Clostridia bacterium]|nr:S-layer homology domain-containing protein [Clostridia bacterium]
MKAQRKRIALLMAIMMVINLLPNPLSFVYATASEFSQSGGIDLSTYSAGDELAGGKYYLSSNLNFNGSSIGNGLRIAADATVVIYLNGYTLTATGKNAGNGASGSGTTGGSGSGQGGYAGILLPATSTLIFVGKGTVNATGGAAGNGGAGGNATSGGVSKSPNQVTAGAGGAGGQGGGGAGAGIGTNGSDGGAGGAGASGSQGMSNWGPSSGTNGSNSSNSANAGKLFVYSNNGNDGSITMNLTGGTAGTAGGAAGSVGNSVYDSGTGWTDNYTGSSGAGGGGGGAGYGASGYGAGGVGGAGGAGGASGSIHVQSSGWSFYFGQSGNGGAGAVNGTQGNGSAIGNYSCSAYDDSADYDKYMSGTAASGGTAGTVGGNAGYTTYYLNGMYAVVTALGADDNIRTYKPSDYIAKSDVEVYAVYSTNSATEFTDTTDMISKDTTSTDGFSNPTVDSNFRVLTVPSTYWIFTDASSESGHEGEHYLTYDEVLSFTSKNADTPTTGKVEVEFDDTFYATCESFVRNIRVGMDAQQTIDKNDGTDATEQVDADLYTEYGDAATYNELPAINAIVYDNDTHTLAELIEGTGYGLNNSPDDDAAITDAFFKNGLNTDDDDDDAYWAADYALDPYYQVKYTPYNAFVDYDAVNAAAINGNVEKNGSALTYAATNYLTGTNEAVILGGERYSDALSVENGAYVTNGEIDQYFALDQLAQPLIKNAGLYTVTVVVPYKYYSYLYVGDNWFGDSVSNSNYSYFFRTYTFNIIVRQADLEIIEATDTVYENTKVQAHTFDRYVEGQNDEQVYGKFTYASDHGESWGNGEDRTVNTNHTSYTDIEWEFNLYEEEYYDVDENTIDGQKNINNYLCQYDGESAELQEATTNDVQNTYYKGGNGVLLFTTSTIATRDADMVVTFKYASAQSNPYIDNEKVASEDLNTLIVSSDDDDVDEIESTYAEDIEFTAEITSESLGWRVVKNDAVTGEILSGTKIESADELAEGYRSETYYNKLITNDGKYKGDLYIITVKAGDTVVKTLEYTDETARNTVNNIPSTLLRQVTDDLPACDYYGVDNYDIKVEYIGLYYTAETNSNGRLPGWNGEEEFNWVISEVNFELDVEPRNVTLKNIEDIDKVYDATTYVVKQTITNGDATVASKYIIDLAETNDANTQFEKQPHIVLYNYLDPTDLLTNTLSVGFVGSYDNKNKGEDRAVTITDITLMDGTTVPEPGDQVDALNYRILDSNGDTDGMATATGDINVAQMHFSHILSGTMVVRDLTPLHEAFEISLKAYLLNVDDTTDAMTMEYTELVEKDDAKTLSNNTFVTNADEYDYDASYEINRAKYKQYIDGSNLEINEDTGAIVTASTVTKGGTNPSNFPAMNVTLSDYANFTVVPQVEDTEIATYNQCAVSADTNGLAFDNEHTDHIIRFRIIGNNNSYDVLLPINQLNVRGNDYISKFLKTTADELITGDDEIYNYVALYPNNDSTEFEFSIPQDSYLKDVAIVALEDYKVYDEEASMPTYTDLVASIENKTANVIGTFETQVEGMNTIDNALFMTLDEVNGTAYDADVLQVPNDQIGGSKFKFTLTTGECNLGEEYAIVIVPITEEYGKLLDKDYKANLSLERTITSAEDSTLTFETAQDDYVYVNYKTVWDTTADGTLTMSYGEAEDLVIPLNATNMNEFSSLGINTEDYATFFDPKVLLPGTKVTAVLDVVRNGTVPEIQVDVDSDVIDQATYEWTVSEEDYYRLFKDDVVTVRNSKNVEADNEIATAQVVNNIIGYIFAPDVALNSIPLYVTNHKNSAKTKDSAWSVQENFNMLSKYSKTLYNIDETALEIDETTNVASNLALGMSIYSKATSGGSSSSGGGSSSSSSSTKYTITTKNPTNGKISPSNPRVTKGDDQKFTFSANDGYEIEDVLVDGESVGAVSAYTLRNVKETHTIKLEVTKVDDGSTSGDNTSDGNTSDGNTSGDNTSDGNTSGDNTPGDNTSGTEDDEPVVWSEASVWAESALNTANKEKMIPNKFSNRNFKDVITRREFAIISLRLWEKLTNQKADFISINPFVDTDDEDVLKAYAIGITAGTSKTTFEPDKQITREQMAVMLRNTLKSIGIDTNVDLNFVSKFDDDVNIHEWAKEAVYFMSRNGIIGGVGNNRVDPLGNATIEQSLIVNLRSLQAFIEE